MSNINQLVMDNLFEAKSGDSDYDQYFQQMMKKWNIKSPRDLSREKRKEFFDAVDKGYKAANDKKW